MTYMYSYSKICNWGFLSNFMLFFIYSCCMPNHFWTKKSIHLTIHGACSAAKFLKESVTRIKTTTNLWRISGDSQHWNDRKFIVKTGWNLKRNTDCNSIQTCCNDNLQLQVFWIMTGTVNKMPMNIFSPKSTKSLLDWAHNTQEWWKYQGGKWVVFVSREHKIA